MSGMRLRLLAGATLVSLLVLPGADAGQQWVKVGQGGNVFAPPTATLNRGDHVTWVWVSTNHSVTSGLDGNDLNAGAGFDSDTWFVIPTAFSWKADTTASTVDYFCWPHWSLGMTAQLDIRASGFPVANFRITEVQYNEASGKDRIEIANLGGDYGDLGRYRIAIDASSSVVVPLNTFGVFGGVDSGRVVIHTNENLPNTATDLYMPAIGDLPASGSVALYVPNTTTSASLTDPKQIIDFVQWGAGGHPNVATAVAAGVWPSAGEFVDPVPLTGDYDLAFCGPVAEYGKSLWKVAHPNFRSQNLCATPTVATTWGRIKVLYR